MKIVFLLLLFSIQSIADVIFVDVNFSTKEIEAAQRAAKARGEKLIVFPDLTLEKRMVLDKKYVELRAAKKSFNDKCGSEVTNKAKDCGQITAKFVATNKDVDSYIEKNVTPVNKDNFGKFIKDLSDKNTKVSSVVVSGHDGNGWFGGSFGEIKDEEFKEVFEKNKELSQNVRSLLLWGCHTSNLGAIQINWKGILPNLNVIAGYNEVAPGNDKLGSSTYLEDMLIKEKELSAAKDQKTLHALFKSLKNVNVMNASACVGDNYMTPKEISSFSEKIKECNLKSEAYKKHKEVMDCYYKAQKGCEQPPSNMYSGPLRDAYTFLQAHRHCKDVIKELYPTEYILRLMHYKNVAENFSKLNAESFADFNKLLKKLQVPAHLQDAELGKMTRAEYLSWMGELYEVLSNQQKSLSWHDPVATDVRAAREYLSTTVNTTLTYLHPQCIPFPWVEAGAKSASKCNYPMEEYMTEAKEQTLKEIPGEDFQNLVIENSKVQASFANVVSTGNEEVDRKAQTAALCEHVDHFATVQPRPDSNYSTQQKIIFEANRTAWVGMCYDPTKD